MCSGEKRDCYTAGESAGILGLILVLGASLGDAAERAKVPWISGCIVAGVVLGPAATGVLRGPKLEGLDGFTQASLAVIAFNIGSQLAVTRLKAIGGSIALLALAQLLTPFVLVFVAETMAGLAHSRRFDRFGGGRGDGPNNHILYHPTTGGVRPLCRPRGWHPCH